VHKDEGLKRLRKVEAMIIDKLGEDWLNSGATKDMGFGLLQIATSLAPPAAIVIVTVVNWFRPTKAFYKLPEDRKQYFTENHDRHHEAVSLGYFRIEDALCAIAQTPERVGTVILPKSSKRLDAHFGDAADFQGRTKMFVSHQEAIEALLMMRAAFGLDLEGVGPQ
jgi:hypothetical protein